MEEYSNTLRIEALTMSSMVRQEVLPAIESYTAELASAISAKRAVAPDIPCAMESALLRQLSALSDQAYQQVGDLDQALTDPRTKSPNILTTATYYKDIIIPRMESLRAVVDQAEQNMPAARWPFPSYAELMFRV